MKCSKCNYEALTRVNNKPLCALHSWKHRIEQGETVPKIEILLQAIGINCEYSWPHRRHYYTYLDNQAMVKDCEILCNQGFLRRGEIIKFPPYYEYGIDKDTGRKITTGDHTGYQVRVYWITPEGTEYCDSARLRITSTK